MLKFEAETVDGPMLIASLYIQPRTPPRFVIDTAREEARRKRFLEEKGRTDALRRATRLER